MPRTQQQHTSLTYDAVRSYKAQREAAPRHSRDRGRFTVEEKAALTIWGGGGCEREKRGPKRTSGRATTAIMVHTSASTTIIGWNLYEYIDYSCCCCCSVSLSLWQRERPPAKRGTGYRKGVASREAGWSCRKKEENNIFIATATCHFGRKSKAVGVSLSRLNGPYLSAHRVVRIFWPNGG